MKTGTFVTSDGKRLDVVTDVLWGPDRERAVVVNGVVILAPTPTRAEASARLDKRMKELIASGEAASLRQALDYAMQDDPDAAKAYRE
jgi:hypothetical protein